MLTEKERRSRSARYGHIQRRILQDEPLSKPLLALALEKLDQNREMEKKIAEKLRKSIALDEYEKHVMVEGILLSWKFEDC